SRIGHLRFTFPVDTSPYILLEATRAACPNCSWPTCPIGSISAYPLGTCASALPEICGRKPERQDRILGPSPAPSFAVQNGSISEDAESGEGSLLSAYVRFANGTTVVDVRVGVSFISEENARASLEREVPDGTSLVEAARRTREAWVEKLGRVKVEGTKDDQRAVFYTDSVHEGGSYTGYSIWDTYRAEWAWQILLAPERIPGMVRSMLQDYQQSGWLPMWKNIVETNIMVGQRLESTRTYGPISSRWPRMPTRSLLRLSSRASSGFDVDLAYEAVYKDATAPPVDDWTISYYDREEGVGYEVHAGLSSVYEEKGWPLCFLLIAIFTRDHADDDYAVSALAEHLGHTENATFFRNRALTAPFAIFNSDTGFMEARDANDSWAGQDQGWTEGDMRAYTFDVIQDIPGLIECRGENASFVAFLDEHFDGGHNDHTNELSHHIPHLYALAGAASKSQERSREVAEANYNSSVNGLSGNEDCGQMSAWYIFSALAFYPVDPVSAEYVVGTPFYDKVTIDLPASNRPLIITSKGAPSMPYIKSLTLNGESVEVPIIRHEQIVSGGEIVFEMSAEPQAWASATLVGGESASAEADAFTN
ncbi:glycoside hydrolase family 92 protein, partial [Laetiporus sulphureus 93-53]